MHVLMPAMTAAAYAPELFAPLDDALDVLIAEVMWRATVLGKVRKQTAAHA